MTLARLANWVEAEGLAADKRAAKPRLHPVYGNWLLLRYCGLGLRGRNLNVRDNVRVAAFLITRIHRGRSVTVGCAVNDRRVCI